MHKIRLLIAVWALALMFTSVLQASPEDGVARVREAADRSTLDQPGTKPFHLKAVLAPSNERDADTDRNGEVEIWWVSPTRFRREVRSPKFAQVEIVDGARVWQKSRGNYFPEWLRETAVALVRPFPHLDQTLANVKDADIKKLAGSTYYQWSEISTDGNVQKGMGATVAITDSTRLLFYAGGLGWGGLYKDYQKFHNRVVARMVSHGSREVTAKIVLLEDFDPSAGASLLDATGKGADEPTLQTLVVDEPALRKHLVSQEAPSWPTLQDGPFEGTVTTSIEVDREGTIREIGTIVSDNQAVNDTARKSIATMKFSPYVIDGNPVQVVSRITMPFKTARPSGSETFESAQTYFERGRQDGFLAAANKTPYVLRGDFEAGTSAGKVEKGQYEDTWSSDTQWRREARIGNSRYVRSRNGDRRYQLAEGTDAPLLKFVLKLMEPIPAIDTFYEGDWHIRRDDLNGTTTIRVLSGYVAPNGTLDQNVRAYWFSNTGDLLKVHVNGLDVLRLDFQGYSQVKIARHIEVRKNGALGMQIQVTEISTNPETPTKFYELKGHEWTRAFTDEVR
jgi:hypothetical protein